MLNWIDPALLTFVLAFSFFVFVVHRYWNRTRRRILLVFSAYLCGSIFAAITVLLVDWVVLHPPANVHEPLPLKYYSTSIGGRRPTAYGSQNVYTIPNAVHYGVLEEKACPKDVDEDDCDARVSAIFASKAVGSHMCEGEYSFDRLEEQLSVDDELTYIWFEYQHTVSEILQNPSLRNAPTKPENLLCVEFRKVDSVPAGTWEIRTFHRTQFKGFYKKSEMVRGWTTTRVDHGDDPLPNGETVLPTEICYERGPYLFTRIIFWIGPQLKRGSFS